MLPTSVLMQVAALANIPEQQQHSDSASDDDIGEELQASLAGDEEADSAPAKPVSASHEPLSIAACTAPISTPPCACMKAPNPDLMACS